MDSKRTRLRSQTAVSKVFLSVYSPGSQENLQGVDIVEVEVEGEHDRGFPIVRSVNKRKRDPRGGGRRLQQRLDTQENNHSVTVDDNANASSDEINKTNERYGSINRNEVLFSAASPTAVNTYVIIPEIMSQEQAAMKQLDKRRGSSRLRVRPSKFREGFLLNSGRQKGDQKTGDDVTTALEIVLPMEGQNAMAAVDARPSASSRVSVTEIESKNNRLSQTSAGKNKFKISYKSGAAKNTEISGGAADSSPSSRKGYDEIGLKSALGVLKRIMQIKSAEPFNEPVDPIALEIPDYHDVIKEPMDLGTIRELLEEGKKYRTVKDVADDVQLVWSNCRDYNQEGDPIMDILKIAENCFNKYWIAAGLPAFPSSTKDSNRHAQHESNFSESNDEIVEKDETKRRKSKDSKSVTMQHSSKVVHFDKPSLKSKTQRSASVEQVMAESKAREDKLEVEDAALKKEVTLSSQGHAREMVEEEHLQGNGNESLQTPRELEKTRGSGHFSRSEVNVLKDCEAKQAEVQTLVNEETRISLQDKDNPFRGSTSNKRRTFGTVHHKPDCSCVVCVGRRRKLARQEREGVIEVVNKKKSKSHSHVTQESSQTTTAHFSKVTIPPKPPEVQETPSGSTALLETEVVVEPSQPDSQIGNSAEVDGLVEGVRFYPATYELPLRRVNTTVFHLSQILFDSNHSNVWRRHHSLGNQCPPKMSNRSMFEAVHSLTLNER